MSGDASAATRPQYLKKALPRSPEDLKGRDPLRLLAAERQEMHAQESPLKMARQCLFCAGRRDQLADRCEHHGVYKASLRHRRLPASRTDHVHRDDLIQRLGHEAVFVQGDVSQPIAKGLDQVPVRLLGQAVSWPGQ
jgi:hypothetical protein